MRRDYMAELREMREPEPPPYIRQPQARRRRVYWLALAVDLGVYLLIILAILGCVAVLGQGMK